MDVGLRQSFASHPGAGEDPPKNRTEGTDRFALVRSALLLSAFLIPLAALPHNRVNAFDDALIEAFRAKAPAAWECYRSKGFIYRAEVSTTITESAQGTTVRKKFLCKEQIAHRSVEELAIVGDPKFLVSVFAFNPDYQFALHKPATAKDWILTNLLIGRTREEPMMADASAQLAGGIHEILLNVGPARLPELMKESTFKILGAQPVRVGEASCIKIEFDNTHALKTESSSPVQSGWFIVDPNQSWCVRDYQVKTMHANSHAVHSVEKLEIRASAFPGYPLPVELIRLTKTVATEAGFEGSESVRRSVTTYQIDDATPLSLSEFRLPAYHLPEPEGLDHWYLLYHAMGIATLMAASVVLFRIYRKKNPSA